MKEIKYPVSLGQEPEGEPDAETMLVLRDATGRDLDVEEIAAALNASAPSHAPRSEAELCFIGCNSMTCAKLGRCRKEETTPSTTPRMTICVWKDGSYNCLTDEDAVGWKQDPDLFVSIPLVSGFTVSATPRSEDVLRTAIAQAISHLENAVADDGGFSESAHGVSVHFQETPFDECRKAARLLADALVHRADGGKQT